MNFTSIEWDSDKDRRKKSTIHGWLAKMRGTISGNERVRSEGMKEMRQAREQRARQAERKKADKARARKNGGGYSLFGGSSKKAKLSSTRRPDGSRREPSRRGSTRPDAQRKPSGMSSRSAAASRPDPKRKGSGRPRAHREASRRSTKTKR